MLSKNSSEAASALNHYHNDSEVHFCSMRPAQIRTGCIAKAEPALISHTMMAHICLWAQQQCEVGSDSTRAEYSAT